MRSRVGRLRGGERAGGGPGRASSEDNAARCVSPKGQPLAGRWPLLSNLQCAQAKAQGEGLRGCHGTEPNSWPRKAGGRKESPLPATRSAWFKEETVKKGPLRRPSEAEGEPAFDTEFPRQTHQKGLVPRDSGWSQERGSEWGLGDGRLDEGVGCGLREVRSAGGRESRPKRGGECHDVRAQGPRLGSPCRPGSEHKPCPPPPPALAGSRPPSHQRPPEEPALGVL